MKLTDIIKKKSIHVDITGLIRFLFEMVVKYVAELQFFLQQLDSNDGKHFCALHLRHNKKLKIEQLLIVKRMHMQTNFISFTFSGNLIQLHN